MNRRVALLLAALAAAPVLQARVFWGMGDEEAGLIGSADPGYRLAYLADLRINGTHAKAGVWGTARTPDEVLSALHARAEREGAHAAFASGGSIAWGIVVTADQRVHRILVSAAEGRYAHVFQLTQSAEEYFQSLRPPARLPFDAPEPPAGRIDATYQNETAGGAVAVVTCASPPLAVRPAYAEQLGAAGWQRAPAGAGDAALFLRRGELLLVSVKRTGDDGASLVTLVHKRLRTGDRI